MGKIAITKENQIYSGAELDFTHDHSTVVVGSIMIGRNGAVYEVTKIDEDDCGRRRFWSGKNCLTVQYSSPHNMLTKKPFFANNFKIN